MTADLLERDARDLDTPAPPTEKRRNRVLIGTSLLVALIAGVAIAFFLTTQNFGQQVTGQAVVVQIEGLDNAFDDEAIQPGLIVDAAITARNGEPNRVPIEYTISAEFVPTGVDDAAAEQQFSELETRLCEDVTEESFAFVLPIPGTEETSTSRSCGAWEPLDTAQLDLGEFDLGDERDFVIELRLIETGEEQPAEITTAFDFVAEARTTAN